MGQVTHCLDHPQWVLSVRPTQSPPISDVLAEQKVIHIVYTHHLTWSFISTMHHPATLLPRLLSFSGKLALLEIHILTLARPYLLNTHSEFIGDYTNQPRQSGRIPYS